MDRREAIKRTGFFIGGTALSATIFSNIVSCQNSAATDIAAWKPSFLSVEQGKIVQTITDILIPATDTPGAVDAGVPAYIDTIVKDIFSGEEQKALAAGFADFSKKCKEANGAAFTDCTPEQQLSFLQALEKEAQGAEGPTFIGAMKDLTYRGYFTSEAGMMDVLDYNPVPGNYDGCVPVGT